MIEQSYPLTEIISIVQGFKFRLYEKVWLVYDWAYCLWVTYFTARFHKHLFFLIIEKSLGKTIVVSQIDFKNSVVFGVIIQYVLLK